jgi:hypothetical protein
MKKTLCLPLFALSGALAFLPKQQTTFHRVQNQLGAKYNTMEEILALFPEDKPTLINFYDANTENQIKDDIFRAKNLLKGESLGE